MPKHYPRVKVEEADNAIFRPQNNIQGDPLDHNIGDPILKESVYYTMFGQHDYLDSEGNPVLESETSTAFARQTVTNGRNPRYYIKCGQHGRFCSPLGADEGRHNKVLKHAGKNAFNWEEVPKIAFLYYLKFLRTKNLANLRLAEREVF